MRAAFKSPALAPRAIAGQNIIGIVAHAPRAKRANLRAAHRIATPAE
jgi:hypothetical protein